MKALLVVEKKYEVMGKKKNAMDGGKPNHNLAGCHPFILFLKIWKILPDLFLQNSFLA